MRAARITPTALWRQLQGGSVKARALRGSGLTILDVGASNFLRLLSNLVLTRLLFPEAFGLMALMQVFIYGLQMFSDLGIHTMLIQHKRGADRDFCNVLWTLQILRGVVLWLGACLIAWPVAQIYDQSEIAAILPVLALTLLVEGFKPTREALANRELLLGRIVTLNLITGVIALTAMVVAAVLLQSVWALVIGSILGACVRVIVFDLYMPGERNRLAWDRQIVREALGFGVFIFLSTICTFLNRMGGRLVLGAYVNMATFGIFSIATMLGTVPGLITTKMAQSVIFPLYRMKPPGQSAENQRNLFKAKRMTSALAVAMSCVLAVIGVWLIDVLYDPRYALAGPMLVLIALSAIPVNACVGAQQALLGHGDSRRNFHLTAMQAGIKLVALLIAASQFGVAGVILTNGVVGLIMYPLRSAMIRRYDAWDPAGELGLMAIGFAVTGAACWFHWDRIATLF